MSYQNLTEEQFYEYLDGITREELVEAAASCIHLMSGECGASSPGGRAQCMFCKSVMIPDDHPWKKLVEKN